MKSEIKPGTIALALWLLPFCLSGQLLNPAAFKIPATVPNFKGLPIPTFGNSSRMVLRGPSQRNLDFSVFKDFRLGEKRRIEFRAESFNLTNTPYFTLSSPTSAALTVGNAGFGKLASSQTVGRQLQFGFKVVW